MSESILKALMQLFALISDIHDDSIITSREKDIIRKFLVYHLNAELANRYMKLFEENVESYNSGRIVKGSIKDRKRTALNAMRILSICEKINEELQQKQKIYVLVKLLDYISSGDKITENELDFLNTVASAFNIPIKEFAAISTFILKPPGEQINGLIIDSEKDKQEGELKHITNPNLRGTIRFIYVTSTTTCLMRYSGNEDLYLNGQNIHAAETYVFDQGSSIRGSGIKTIYHSEVINLLSSSNWISNISIEAKNVSFRFRNSENGIHGLNFTGKSGEFTGILGGSGAGKTTALSILSGTLKPHSGQVLINGYDLYNYSDRQKLRGFIGFIPQDDLLIEELTVYQNLYYNAKMCLNNLNEEKLGEALEKTLYDFDLYEIKDLKVGNPLIKVISGGQRKRINIALELMREPLILFVDEPTSGLSSLDSEMVMNLLKDQAGRGRIIIVNIHQPSSDIYKMFNNIMIIDKGGYQIYYGNPNEAIIYFKSQSNHANPDEDQCVKCGNVDAEQLLHIIESKIIDENGKATRIRKISPAEWAEKFRKKSSALSGTSDNIKTALPENLLSIPGYLKQSSIFFIRDLLSKLANKQYIIISLIGPPLLSFLLAWFIKTPSEDYVFRDNENFPAFLFMCVITSMFFGLMGSSEEIVSDRKILKRESFLNLSWFSYLNSKILLLFILSAIQTLSFVIIGNLILEVKGMTLSFWLVLFTTSCFANILGLILSSAFTSVISIYILIPFILIPQLLFSGVLVKFDNLHLNRRSSHEFVPVLGDLMIARWSFEALAVEQFKNNAFEKLFFKHDMNISQNNWYASFLIENLKQNLLVCSRYNYNPGFSDEVKSNYRKLHHYITQLSDMAGITQTMNLPDQQKFNPASQEEISAILDTLKTIFLTRMKNAMASRDSIIKSVEESSEDSIIDLNQNHENKRLKSIVLEEENTHKTFETEDRIIQKYQPGLMKAVSKNGRAHFYAPVKRIGNFEMDTYYFNIAVIWFLSIIFYLTLLLKLPEKFVAFFEKN